jgi:DNA-binding IclR family transcriptional regulator
VDGEIVVVEIVDGPKAPRIDLWVGVHDAAHATALGKSILAQLAADEREDYLARHPLHDLTPRTVVDRRRLQLPRPGEVAVDDGEYAVGICCLAAAVPTTEGPGTVAVVSSPAQLGRPATRRTLLSAAGRVSRALTLGAA